MTSFIKKLSLTSVIISTTILGMSTATSAEQQAPQAMPVQVVEVIQGTTTFSQDLPGRVSAYRVAEVRARVNGIVEERLFTEGQIVSAQQPLFQIDDRTLVAELSAATAKVKQEEAQLAVSKQMLKRYKNLLELGAVSQQEFDSQFAQTEQDKAKVATAKAAYKKATIDVEFSKVLAPIDGRIGKAMVTEGALVNSSSATHMATIEQVDKVYIDFTRSMSDVSRLKDLQSGDAVNGSANTTIKVMMPDGSPYAHDGVLQFSSVSVNSETGALQLRAVVDNPKQNLLPGMFVRVKMPVAESTVLTQVPQKSIQMTQQGPVVKMVKNGAYAMQPVELGPMIGEQWVIKQGLKGGEQVIVSDTSFLQPGMPVMPIPITNGKQVQNQADSQQAQP